MSIISVKHLRHNYDKFNDEGEKTGESMAIDDLSFEIAKGTFVAVLGHNGSGKSTLARHFNSLLQPSEGVVHIKEYDTSDPAHIFDVRRTAGMVFQNPDNQIIANVVEEDVAFGPENLAVPTDEIWKRVDDALEKTGMAAYRLRSPGKLSGGQKQRVAIAGIMAMKPEIIVLDEPTAMLDPNGRREVIETIRALNKKEHVTVILITHYMEEVVNCDRVIVMDEGRLVMDGTPREIFSRVQELSAIKLTVPQITELAWRLKKDGLPLPDGVLTADELIADLHAAVPVSNTSAQAESSPAGMPSPGPFVQTEENPAPAEKGLCLDHVSYVYDPDAPNPVRAIDDVTLTIPEDQFIGVIGHTGSGKSTLMQLFNGLLKPTSGRVLLDGKDVFAEGYPIRHLRFTVGLVFQYPEHQLFEETVLKDVCFGPKNQGLSEEEQLEKAKKALRLVDLPEEFWDHSPFELSGGQKRRAAIAGVLAMEPRYLILDEPTAGLDPKGRDEILGTVERLRRERRMTVILVSHSMEDVAVYAGRLLVVDGGKILFDDTPRNVFHHRHTLERIGLALPQMMYLAGRLRREGYPVPPDLLTVPEAEQAILRCAGRSM